MGPEDAVLGKCHRDGC